MIQARMLPAPCRADRATRVCNLHACEQETAEENADYQGRLRGIGSQDDHGALPTPGMRPCLRLHQNVSGSNPANVRTCTRPCLCLCVVSVSVPIGIADACMRCKTEPPCSLCSQPHVEQAGSTVSATSPCPTRSPPQNLATSSIRFGHVERKLSWQRTQFTDARDAAVWNPLFG